MNHLSVTISCFYFSYMNITLEAAQLVNLDGYCYHYDTMYIKGRNIRFIHLPKQVSSLAYELELNNFFLLMIQPIFDKSTSTSSVNQRK